MKKKKNEETHSALNEIKKFYDFMTSNKLEVIEFSQGDTYIKLARKSAQATPNIHPIPIFTGASAPVSSLQPSQTSNKVNQQAPAQVSGETIKAPMSGIFYRAPSPSSPPYVREGDNIQKGQVLCIIEAMKVFNEIKADFNFKIVKVLVENGKPVTINNDLFLIERI